jgi:Mg2+/Co2+ transporter CorB
MYNLYSINGLTIHKKKSIKQSTKYIEFLKQKLDIFNFRPNQLSVVLEEKMNHLG